jgi:hypothetical protein
MIMYLTSFIILPLALYGTKSPGAWAEFVVIVSIGVFFGSIGIIISKFSRKNDNSRKKEKSEPAKYNKYGEPTFYEPTPPKSK